MPSSLGPAEILVILVVALIVLGPKRLPEAGRQVGKAISEVRRWSQDVKYEMNQAFNPEVVVRDATPLAEPAPAPTSVDPPEPVVEPPVAEDTAPAATDAASPPPEERAAVDEPRP
jgi:sec-independent protein translocase protein TatA